MDISRAGVLCVTTLAEPLHLRIERLGACGGLRDPLLFLLQLDFALADAATKERKRVAHLKRESVPKEFVERTQA